jgi:hypothetical protein
MSQFAAWMVGQEWGSCRDLFQVFADSRFMFHCHYSDDAEKLCQCLDLQQLQQVCNLAAVAVEASVRQQALQQALQEQLQREEDEVMLKEQKKKEAAAALKVGVEGSSC